MTYVEKSKYSKLLILPELVYKAHMGNKNKINNGSKFINAINYSTLGIEIYG